MIFSRSYFSVFFFHEIFLWPLSFSAVQSFALQLKNLFGFFTSFLSRCAESIKLSTAKKILVNFLAEKEKVQG